MQEPKVIWMQTTCYNYCGEYSSDFLNDLEEECEILEVQRNITGGKSDRVEHLLIKVRRA